MVSLLSLVLLTTLMLPPSTLSEDIAHTALPSKSPVSSHSGLATAISWSFNDGTEGWGAASDTEMNAHVYTSSGSLRVAIAGSNPHLDSPALLLQASDRHTLALRYKYTGRSNVGKFVLRGNTAANAKKPEYVDYKDADWVAKSGSTDFFEDIYFPVIGDGQWRVAYASFQTKDTETNTLTRFFEETLQQIRLHPVVARNADSVDGKWIESPAPSLGTAVLIDWIELMSAPVIERVTGCNGEQYHSTIDFSTWKEENYQLKASTTLINTFLPHEKTLWERRHVSTDTTFARSYNCLRTGGETITLEGRHFGLGGTSPGTAAAQVFIGGNPCTDVLHDENEPQSKLTCVTPVRTDGDYSDEAMRDVVIRHGKLPGLNDTVPFFSYAKPAPVPSTPTASNVAASSLDISWSPGGDIWDHMTVTGYEVVWREASSTTWDNKMVVGNVTTTTIIALSPGTDYIVAISAAVEDQNDDEWEALDKYGRRALLENGLLGDKTPEVAVTTLAKDFDFTAFTAASTLDQGAAQAGATVGPTGVSAGEGHFGLYIIGDANIENCNSSLVCCDNFDYSTNTCPSASKACSSTVHPNPSYVNDEVTGRRVPDNLAGGEKWVLDEAAMAPLQATAACGPALRLTASSPRLSGSAWYQREQEVGEGFDTTFTFRVANPSLRCDIMDDVHTNCRSRGADGFAFVIQQNSMQALGEAGENLGYGGITNSLAVEFDTYYNPDLLEPYENHISVQTRGWREPNSPDQSYSLGHTNEVRDLTDGEIKVRVKYEPTFDNRLLANPHFMSSSYVSHFLENADFKNGGQADWGVGMGTLSVYVENLVDAVLIVPLSLESTLNLNHGRAWVGFTAGTGYNTWQVHDILDWEFRSLRMDKIGSEVMSPVVNGENAFGCSGGDDDAPDCRHK
jgi:hypothetical protein